MPHQLRLSLISSGSGRSFNV